VRHATDGTLRRLVDEPFAVADSDVDHLAGCGRCRLREELIAGDAATTTTLLSHPQPVPDVDAAWQCLQASLSAAPASSGARLARVGGGYWPSLRFRLPRVAVLAAASAVIVGAGAVAALTASPAHDGPTGSGSATDVQALADVTGLEGGSGILGGFGTSSGAIRLPFGLLRWSSAGAAHSVGSLAAASEATGLHLASPTNLPAGVENVSSILVQPRVTATIRLNATAGALAGQSLTIMAGPAVLVEYGASSSGFGLPMLGIFAMGKPSVAPTTSTTAALEAYVLARPGVPPGLTQEIRLLSDLGTVLPVPVPPGASLSQVDVAGSPGVLLTDRAMGVSGVLWEDHAATVRAAVGFLDGRALLNVADQLG
jgi:hypothetical protein